MKRFLTLLAVVLAYATTQSVSAWNNIGHATIAVIAERHMTEEAKETVRKLMELPYPEGV